ncbi:MAG: oxygenase MpaB family protein [Agriterribacter sp.]
MENFVDEKSVVRKIWGRSDTILFIFAGAAAEFALNKAVDWLYFTGKLPADPIGRLFSTVGYARQIIFADKDTAHAAIDKMNTIHQAVEKGRGAQIPEWAYRDVLFMLIHYSVASFELLERKLTDREKEEVLQVFLKVGERMQVKDLPVNYSAWQQMHAAQLEDDLQRSRYTDDLFKQYKKHLGIFRYFVLKEVQSLLAPHTVKRLLSLNGGYVVKLILPLYRFCRKIQCTQPIQDLLMPSAYKHQLKQLNYNTATYAGSI